MSREDFPFSPILAIKFLRISSKKGKIGYLRPHISKIAKRAADLEGNFPEDHSAPQKLSSGSRSCLEFKVDDCLFLYVSASENPGIHRLIAS